MSWTDILGSVMQAGGGAGGNRQQAGAGDLGQIAGAVSAAFRDDSTPPAPQMIAGLFGQAGSHQQAGILNLLLSVLGPALASGALSGLLRNTPLAPLAGMLGGGAPQVTPELASRVGPDTVHQLAEHATQADPSVLDNLGGLVAQNPELLQQMGGGLLGGLMGGGDSQQQGAGDAGLGQLLGGLLGGNR